MAKHIGRCTIATEVRGKLEENWLELGIECCGTFTLDGRQNGAQPPIKALANN